jgi:DNA-binding LytR/AlgR family response regulator
MSGHVVTITLPEMVYEQIRRAAERSHRQVEDVLAEAVAAVAPVMDNPPGTLRSALAHLAYLNDAALWQAARTTMPAAQRERLDSLHEKQQRQPLTTEERTEEQALLALYRETLLVRGQAAILLRQRAYDISDPRQFSPRGRGV